MYSSQVNFIEAPSTFSGLGVGVREMEGIEDAFHHYSAANGGPQKICPHPNSCDIIWEKGVFADVIKDSLDETILDYDGL